MMYYTLRAEHAAVCPSGRLAAYKQQYFILLFSSRVILHYFKSTPQIQQRQSARAHSAHTRTFSESLRRALPSRATKQNKIIICTTIHSTPNKQRHVRCVVRIPSQDYVFISKTN